MCQSDQADESQQAETLPHALWKTKKLCLIIEGGKEMRKSRLIKMLAMALALVMLMSVTAFADTPTRYFTADGRTATGNCYVKSASTSYDTFANYIYAEITYYYRIGNTSTIHNNNSSTATATYSTNAFTDVLSSDQGKTVTHYHSYGHHKVNSSSMQSTDLNGND